MGKGVSRIANVSDAVMFCAYEAPSFLSLGEKAGFGFVIGSGQCRSLYSRV